MDKQHIMERFAALAGLDPDEIMEYSCLCDAAMLQVRRSLRPGVDAGAEGELLDDLCAALCYYRFALLDGGDEESFKALDLSVSKKRGDRLRGAERLRDDALALASGLLRDPGFYFERA